MSRRCVFIVGVTPLAGAIGIAQQPLAARRSIRSAHTMTVRLSAVPIGSATLSRSSGRVKVSLSVLGLTPGSMHNVDLGNGRCARIGTSLGVVTAAASGQVHRSFETSRAFGRGEILTVRLGTPRDSDGAASSSEPVACATVPGPVTSEVTLVWGASLSPANLRAVSQSLPMMERQRPLLCGSQQAASHPAPSMRRTSIRAAAKSRAPSYLRCRISLLTRAARSRVPQSSQT
jgi:hypothetical protein